jgi:hypothetical protein
VLGVSDVDGLAEFDGLTRWRSLLLRFPDGRSQSHRLVAIAGRLPGEFKRLLNEARTVYERFMLVDGDAPTPMYEWREIEEN